MITIDIHIDQKLAKRVRIFRNALINPYTLGLLALLIFAVPVTSAAAPIALPTTFSANTVISSSAVNDNFTTVTNGVNANDTRLTALESTALTTTGGFIAYAGTAVGNGPLARSHNPAGAVEVSGTNGAYEVRFDGVDCGGDPGTGLAVAQAAGASGISCRANGDWGNDPDTGSCLIYVGCFSTSGSLTSTPFSLLYIR